jgi:hypothetical protein
MVCSNKQGLIHSQYPNSCLLVLEIILIQKKKKKKILGWGEWLKW